MPEKNLLIVAVDGLRASALGAYGNTSFPTSALDEFAADSFLLDNCFAPATDLQATYRALWYSEHPLRPENFAPREKPLPQLFANHGYETTLVTDDPQVAALGAAAGFARCAQVDGTANERATEVAQTALTRLFVAACEVVTGNEDKQLVWVHSRGMVGPWDAPLELQNSLRDEGDPPPVESIEPPDLSIESSDDPDISFRYACAYAAQVMVLDACWESLVAMLHSAGVTDDWLITLLGVRGFPLGEHHRIGGIDDRLYVEQLHIPWIIRFPDGLGRLARRSELTSHLDLLPTLQHYIASDKVQIGRRDGASILPLADKLTAIWRDAVLSTSDKSKRAIRTSGWTFRREANAEDENADRIATNVPLGELFVRPDDRWEANDIAALCADVAAGLSKVADTMCEQLATGQPLTRSELPIEFRTSAHS